MLIDLKLEDKNVLIIGGGLVAETKVRNFLMEKSKVKLISKNISEEIMELSKKNSLNLIFDDISEISDKIKQFIKNSYITIAATDNPIINEKIVSIAKSYSSIVSVVDKPELSDFLSASIIYFGDIKIAISTGGKSPAISKFLRQKFEQSIKEVDILQVKLQEYIRPLLKSKFESSDLRKKLLYKIMKNSKIKKFLKKNKLEVAKIYAKTIIEK
ncbi:MAG: bifunctional precorrin-2 dehydrogenase/sirohydrochlorin ferrochelatase [Candidatus Odinarchaeota archaeon]